MKRTSALETSIHAVEPVSICSGDGGTAGAMVADWASAEAPMKNVSSAAIARPQRVRLDSEASKLRFMRSPTLLLFHQEFNGNTAQQDTFLNHEGKTPARPREVKQKGTLDWRVCLI